jgi:hypothetical protein
VARTRRRRSELILGLGFLVLALAGTGWYGIAVDRWGCPSNDDLMRPLRQDEVVKAFRDRGVALQQTGSRGRITTYRSSAGAATLWVSVCSEVCEANDGRITRRTPRVGQVIFVRNLGFAVTGERTAAAPLLDAVADVTDAVDGPNAGERCYIG